MDPPREGSPEKVKLELPPLALHSGRHPHAILSRASDPADHQIHDVHDVPRTRSPKREVGSSEPRELQSAWALAADPSMVSIGPAAATSSEGTPVQKGSISSVSLSVPQDLSPTRTKRAAVSFDESEGHIEIIRFLREMRADIKEDLHQMRMDVGRNLGRATTNGSARSSNHHAPSSLLSATFSPITSNNTGSRFPSKSTVGPTPTIGPTATAASHHTGTGLSAQPHWWMERGVRSYQVSAEIRCDEEDELEEPDSPRHHSSKHPKCTGPLAKALAHKRKKGHSDKLASVLPALSSSTTHDNAEDSCASPTVTVIPPSAGKQTTGVQPPTEDMPAVLLYEASAVLAGTTGATSMGAGAHPECEMDNVETSIGAKSAFSGHTYGHVASSRAGSTHEEDAADGPTIPLPGGDIQACERKLLSATTRSCSRLGEFDVNALSTEFSLGPCRTTRKGLVRRTALKIVRSGWFDIAGSAAIISNAVAIGWQIDYCAQHHTETLPDGAAELEMTFSMVFLVELLVRMAAYSKNFFTMSGCGWNIFDVIIVSLQLAEELFLAIVPGDEGQASFPVPITLVRMLRILRLVRIVRIVRLLKYMQELRTIVVSTMASMKPLMSTVALLALVVYIVGCYFTQITLTRRIDCQVQACPDKGLDELHEYYGSLGSTSLHLFQVVTGGMDWNDLMVPLAKQISPWLQIVFCIYVMFTSVALMNIVTGVFVETALQRGREDKDVYMINHLREVFQKLDQNHNGLITWNELSTHLREPYVVSFFQDIDIDISEANGLFHLLDRDGSGVLDADEFLTGCLRLRGPAKALDQQLIMRELVEQRHIIGRLVAQSEEAIFKSQDPTDLM